MANVFQPPKTTTADRLANTPIKGELIFDTDEDEMYQGDGVTVGGVLIAGNRAFDFTQVSALTVWNIAHNKGYKPSITVFDTDGDEVFGDVTHNSDNDLTVTFTSAIAGAAHLI